MPSVFGNDWLIVVKGPGIRSLLAAHTAPLGGNANPCSMVPLQCVHLSIFQFIEFLSMVLHGAYCLFFVAIK
jgi:hypothetical protein